MTDTANAPERIWAFHAGPMVGLFIGKKEVGTNVAEYVLAAHCDELVAAAYLDAATFIDTHQYSSSAEGGSMEPARWPGEDRHHATIANAMKNRTPDNARAALTARDERMKAEGAREAQEKIARLTEALRPFSQMAGEMFARNWDAGDIAIALDNPEQSNRVYISDFFAARKAIGAEHASDCAVHNGPAYPSGSCTCGAALQENANG